MSNIYLGANYYPEDWDEELIDFDIEKMKECGFNVVRIAEFSWKKMEPVEGEYDFAWLHRV
ncbi:MAG: beta-galactosidase, partial [Clostridia bacterium]|nr:beta-galactosidase [Clostridia bacterium]